MLLRDFPDSPVVKTLLPLQGVQVPFLIGELGSQMPHCVAKKLKKKTVKRSMLLGRSKMQAVTISRGMEMPPASESLKQET